MKKFNLNQPEMDYNWIELFAWCFLTVFVCLVDILRELARGNYGNKR